MICSCIRMFPSEPDTNIKDISLIHFLPYFTQLNYFCFSILFGNIYFTVFFYIQGHIFSSVKIEMIVRDKI